MPRDSRSARTARYACSDASRAPRPDRAVESWDGLSRAGGPSDGTIAPKLNSRKKAAHAGTPSDRTRSSPRSRWRNIQSGSPRPVESWRTKSSVGPRFIGTGLPAFSRASVGATDGVVMLTPATRSPSSPGSRPRACATPGSRTSREPGIRTPRRGPRACLRTPCRRDRRVGR